MPNIEATVMKKVLPIIYAIDTSGSMQGNKISTLNEAMHECEEILKEKAIDSPDAEIKIGVLKFSSGATWITKSGLVSLEDFYWDNVTAGGVTDLHEALKELNKKLSRSEFLVSETGFCLPVIIFMSDGAPTDESWKKELEKIKTENKWFARARKVAIAIGEDADKEVLRDLVGTMEAVVQANDLDTLKSLIVEVSVSASMLAGQSRMVGDEANGSAILENAIENVEGNPETFEENSNSLFADADTASAVDLQTDDWDDNDWN